MDRTVLQVPASRLLDPSTLATAKVVWMALRLHPGASPAQLEALTGLSGHTIAARLADSAPSPAPGGPRVRIPTALLADETVGAQSKVLYGALQAAPGFRAPAGQFTFPSLSTLTGLSRNTLKRALRDLTRAGWIQLSQEHRFRPLAFTVGSPSLFACRAELAQVRRRLQRGAPKGEALMQEYLSLLIDSDNFSDNARPGFLVNPDTGERLEFDRFYPPSVALEYHGLQHFEASERFTSAEVREQRRRDLIKAGLCVYQNIQLIIVAAEDLSVQAMIRKIGRSLPMRNLTGCEALVDMLEEQSIAYRANAVPGRNCTVKGPAR